LRYRIVQDAAEDDPPIGVAQFPGDGARQRRPLLIVARGRRPATRCASRQPDTGVVVPKVSRSDRYPRIESQRRVSQSLIAGMVRSRPPRRTGMAELDSSA
jgi:hypothetical protein